MRERALQSPTIAHDDGSGSGPALSLHHNSLEVVSDPEPEMM